MALEVFVGRNAVSTVSSGTSDWTSADSSTTPVAAFHVGGNATANDSARNTAGLTAGMTDGTTSRCVSAVSNNNTALTDAAKGRYLVPVAANSPGALFEEGSHSHDSFISGGERLTSTNGFEQAFLWQSMFFADANVAVSEVTLNNTVDVAINTDPGFAWDVVIVTSYQDASGESSDSTLSIGFMTPADNAQGCLMFNDDDNATASDCVMQMSDTYSGGELVNGTGALNYGIDVEVGSGTSADVYPRINGGSLHTVQLLFIGFTDSSQAKIVSWDTPTSTGNDSVTGAGFTPIATIDLLGYASAYDTAMADSGAGGSFGVGFSTEDSQYFAAFSEQYATGGNSDSQSMSTDIAISLPLDDGTSSATTSLRSTHVSMDTDGWTRNWTERDSATARRCITLAIGTPNVSSDTHSIGRGLGRGIGRGIG